MTKYTSLFSNHKFDSSDEEINSNISGIPNSKSQQSKSNKKRKVLTRKDKSDENDTVVTSILNNPKSLSITDTSILGDDYDSDCSILDGFEPSKFQPKNLDDKKEENKSLLNKQSMNDNLPKFKSTNFNKNTMHFDRATGSWFDQNDRLYQVKKAINNFKKFAKNCN